MIKLLRAELRSMCLSWYMLLGVLLCPIIGGCGGVIYQLCVDMRIAPQLRTLVLLCIAVQTLALLLHFMQEKNDGTIRNKIIIGHTKEKIFLAQAIAAAAASAVLWTAALVPFFLFARKSILEIFAGMQGTLLLTSYLMQIVCAALTVVCSALIRGKGYGEITNIVLIAAIAAGAATVTAMLDHEPQFFSVPEPLDAVYAEEELTQAEFDAAYALRDPQLTEELDGSTRFSITTDNVPYLYCAYTFPDREPVRFRAANMLLMRNPHWIGEPLRTVCTGLRMALPVSQAEIFDNYARSYIRTDKEPEAPPVNVGLFPLGSLLLILLLTGTGFAVFRKLDLK